MSDRRKGKQLRVLSQPLHLTLSDGCHHLIYYQGGERERERDCTGARERQTENDSTKPPILLSHTGGNGSVNQLTEWLSVN